jgi:hypothetical protein
VIGLVEYNFQDSIHDMVRGPNCGILVCQDKNATMLYTILFEKDLVVLSVVPFN